MSGKLHGYAHMAVASDADANNLETQRRVLAYCEQVLEDVGSGALLRGSVHLQGELTRRGIRTISKSESLTV